MKKVFCLGLFTVCAVAWSADIPKGCFSNGPLRGGRYDRIYCNAEVKIPYGKTLKRDYQKSKLVRTDPKQVFYCCKSQVNKTASGAACDGAGRASWGPEYSKKALAAIAKHHTPTGATMRHTFLIMRSTGSLSPSFIVNSLQESVLRPAVVRYVCGAATKYIWS